MHDKVGAYAQFKLALMAMLKVADASVTWHIKLGVRSMVPHAYIVESHNRVS